MHHPPSLASRDLERCWQIFTARAFAPLHRAPTVSSPSLATSRASLDDRSIARVSPRVRASRRVSVGRSSSTAVERVTTRRLVPRFVTLARRRPSRARDGDVRVDVRVDDSRRLPAHRRREVRHRRRLRPRTVASIAERNHVHLAVVTALATIGRRGCVRETPAQTSNQAGDAGTASNDAHEVDDASESLLGIGQSSRGRHVRGDESRPGRVLGGERIALAV